MDENKITAICQECGKQFDYILKPGFPRKYCPECSAIKKAEYASKQPIVDEKPEVVKMGEKINLGYPVPQKAVQNNHATMYTSYAKDIFCAVYKNEMLGETVMQEAIELVKQAKEAFE